MVKPLLFKGEKKPKKRKRAEAEASAVPDAGGPSAEEVENDDSWVSAEAVTDVSGPVMLVLPSTEGFAPSALACDATGKVFALEIENIVDGSAASAEPHDVRQVWVVNKIAGTEHYRFKGHHGKFLSCDKHGILSATTEAISPLETFNIVPAEEGSAAFCIQTQRNTFVSVKAPSSSKSKAQLEIRGDVDEMGPSTTLRIRMQARFKPRLKAAKEEKAREKISRKELEAAVGRRLEDDEAKRLKRARREGDYHEQLLKLKAKTKHDKYS